MKKQKIIAIAILISAFLYYYTHYVDIASNKYTSASKINVKFEEYKLSLIMPKNIYSAYGSLQVKNDNDYYVVVKIQCDTKGIPNIGCEQAYFRREVIEIEGRKIDGDIIQPHENKLLSFLVYAEDYPVSTGNYVLKLSVYANNLCPPPCSSEQNNVLLEEAPVYLTIY